MGKVEDLQKKLAPPSATPESADEVEVGDVILDDEGVPFKVTGITSDADTITYTGSKGITLTVDAGDRVGRPQAGFAMNIRVGGYMRHDDSGVENVKGYIRKGMKGLPPLSEGKMRRRGELGPKFDAIASRDKDWNVHSDTEMVKTTKGKQFVVTAVSDDVFKIKQRVYVEPKAGAPHRLEGKAGPWHNVGAEDSLEKAVARVDKISQRRGRVSKLLFDQGEATPAQLKQERDLEAVKRQPGRAAEILRRAEDMGVVSSRPKKKKRMTMLQRESRFAKAQMQMMGLARVYVPPYKRMSKSGVINVEGYWKEISHLGQLSPDEMGAVESRFIKQRGRTSGPMAYPTDTQIIDTVNRSAPVSSTWREKVRKTAGIPESQQMDPRGYRPEAPGRGMSPSEVASQQSWNTATTRYSPQLLANVKLDDREGAARRLRDMRAYDERYGTKQDYTDIERYINGELSSDQLLAMWGRASGDETSDDVEFRQMLSEGWTQQSDGSITYTGTTGRTYTARQEADGTWSLADPYGQKLEGYATPAKAMRRMYSYG